VTAAPLLEVRSLTKRFPGVVALQDVSFQLVAGEVHALCGENGAGKSTLIKLLSGIHPRGSYEGEIRVDGQTVEFASIREAEAAGIAVITQEFALVDELTIAENLFLGREPRRGWTIDWNRMRQRTAELLAEFGLDLSPDLPVRELGIGQKQLLEILRALDKRSRVLVLDEPTAALPEHEVGVLLEHLRRIRAQGTTCIYISHKLDEVFAIADRITVLRDGRSITTVAAAGCDVATVIRHMVGRELGELFPRHAPPAGGELRLAVRGLSVARARGAPPLLRDISFELRAGEVLGFGGLMGAGRTELLMHLFGAWGHRVCGEVSLSGERYDAPTPAESIARGLVLASEDRRRYGLVLEETIGFNLSLSSLAQFTRWGTIRAADEEVRNQHFFSALRIKANDQTAFAGALSGGGQQKVVLGKALMTGRRDAR
jgi:D-xylose transport system ATP-binding protein